MATNNDNEINRVLAIKRALVSTTNTQGWQFIKQIAANVVQKSIQEALDEEDPILGGNRRLKAKALQAGFAELFSAIESTKAFEDPSVEDSLGLGELEISNF